MCNGPTAKIISIQENKIHSCISFHFDYFTYLSPCVFINLSTAAGVYTLWK